MSLPKSQRVFVRAAQRVDAWRISLDDVPPPWVREAMKAGWLRFERVSGPDPIAFVDDGRLLKTARPGDWLVRTLKPEATRLIVWDDALFRAHHSEQVVFSYETAAEPPVSDQIA